MGSPALAHKDGGDVTLRTAGQWKTTAGQAGVTLTPVASGYRVVLAPGVVEAALDQM